MEKSKTFVPQGYKSALSVYETQRAVESLKETLLNELRGKLNLTRVTAPLFVQPSSGMQDNLSGTERAVRFDIPAADGKTAEVVQSLAKWKRVALRDQGFSMGEGIITDMNAIRRDEPVLDNLHSVYVDQWDWEKIIGNDERNIGYLKSVVSDIATSMAATYDAMKIKGGEKFEKVSFVTSQELEDHYPALTPEQREDAYVKDGHPTTFVMGIGGKLKSGEKHGTRSPDYDDWELNGDLLAYSPVLKRAVELSSMGIRVDTQTLFNQLLLTNSVERLELDYHSAVYNKEVPQTIGGGIGQSRFAMLALDKAHIGEVQSSIWDSETIKTCGDAGIKLL